MRGGGKAMRVLLVGGSAVLKVTCEVDDGIGIDDIARNYLRVHGSSLGGGCLFMVGGDGKLINSDDIVIVGGDLNRYVMKPWYYQP